MSIEDLAEHSYIDTHEDQDDKKQAKKAAAVIGSLAFVTVGAIGLLNGGSADAETIEADRCFNSHEAAISTDRVRTIMDNNINDIGEGGSLLPFRSDDLVELIPPLSNLEDRSPDVLIMYDKNDVDVASSVYDAAVQYSNTSDNVRTLEDDGRDPPIVEEGQIRVQAIVTNDSKCPE